ncbi:MAG TPA: DUF1015 domain-containing protein [Candidatus Latescibacteria bacterium]|jgi:hypothetical protein|nr:hypothetical protein [Gemmatimonadaceae bacterium]HJP33647.1 DUF1015 domain-containing protein [Candidatus Latescibacterota bacterium]
MRFPDIALEVPHILLPRDDVAVDTWAVIACDQHTSDPGYWEQVANRTSAVPSTLDLVFPEVYLEAADRTQHLAGIRAAMSEYSTGGILRELAPGFVLVDRQTPNVPSRRGLLVALDLEQYSYEDGARTLIRTTEGTVVSRLAPRIEIRRDTPLEVPHILVLIDDPQRTVIEPLFDADLPALYDTELMFGGGRVRGWQVSGQPLLDQVVSALRALVDTDDDPMLYAMGDGNHSFATAQAVWQEIKQAAGGLAAVADHPARHALVELVNVHDDGLVFEPIHRVLLGCDVDEVLVALRSACQQLGSAVSVEDFDSMESWEHARQAPSSPDRHRLPFLAGQRRGVFTIHDPAGSLPAVSLQELLTLLEGTHPSMEVDYIHGEDAVLRLGTEEGNIGLFSEVIDKHALFPTIRRDGPLPRKSFSLGEAAEKRYYLECRRIA